MTMEKKQPQQPKEIHRAGGVTVAGQRYEQIHRSDNTTAFIICEDGHYSYYESFPDVDAEGKGIRILPMQRIPWKSCGPLHLSLISKDELWQQVRDYLYQHIDFNDDLLYEVVTAWIFASWVPECFESVPYLFFYGPLKSGKTRVLDVLNELCYRALLSANISGPALFRGVEEWKPTLLLDETEIYNHEARSDIIGLLNAGYRRGQHAIRVIQSGDDFKLGLYDVFGFKALAGTERHQRTLQSRSIVIKMFKAKRRVRFVIDHKSALQLRTYLLMWRLKKLEGFVGFEAFPEGIIPPTFLETDGRFIERYFPLHLIADDPARDAILRYAKHAYWIEEKEEETSFEAQVTLALLQSRDYVVKGVIATKDVADTFNTYRPEKERWKTQSVGRVISRLGFNNARTVTGTAGWMWDDKVLEDNIARYNVTLTENTSLGSPSNPTIPTYLDERSDLNTRLHPAVKDPDAQPPLSVESIMQEHRCSDCGEWKGFLKRCVKNPGQLILPTAIYPRSCHHFTIRTPSFPIMKPLTHGDG
jgi:hypothetical protein